MSETDTIIGQSAVIGQSEATCMWCGRVIFGPVRDVLSVQMHVHCEREFRREQDDAVRTAARTG